MGRTVTMLLKEWRAGDQAAVAELIPLVYDELHRIAQQYMRRERPAHTFRPTDLVSEAYLRLSGGAQPEWNDRVHFFAVAAKNMRQILVDHARKQGTAKRGGGERPVPFEDGLVEGAQRPTELLALDEALEELAEVDPRKARAVELHYFGGMTHEEVAAVLDVEARTVARDLRLAEAWIQRALREA